LKTRSLDEDVFGQKAVIDLFQALADAHPDAVFVAKKCRYSPEDHAIKANVYFAGTRITSTVHGHYSYEAEQGNGGSSAKGNSSTAAFPIRNEHLFHNPNTSILTQMDTSMLTQPEIASMLELERTSKNLTIFAKGNFNLSLTRDLSKIERFDFYYTISSFRDAEISY
jgi:hypothetical protein